MTNQELINKINILPEELKREVMDFVDFLSHKYKKNTSFDKKSNYGDAKDIIIIHEDFDEPLEDFQEYV